MRTDADVEPGTVLVAAPTLLDPNFRRTVVYVLEHRGRGTLGVILNRPSEVAVHEVLPSWGPHVTEPASVFVGGSVEQRAALCLAALRSGQDVSVVPGLVGVRGPVALVDLESDPEQLMRRLRGLRVFVGYAGWDSGQLAAEIGRGDWMVLPALPDDVLVPDGVDLWSLVLRRQGMPLALLATHPGDVERN